MQTVAMRNAPVLASLLVALIAMPLHAEESPIPSPDPKITSVISGGHWEDGEEHGSYRVVMWSEGYEHVSSGVLAEWISDPQEAGESPRVVHSRILVAPGLMSLQTLRNAGVEDGFGVILEGTPTYESSLRVSCRFDVLADRTVKAVGPCS